MAATNAAKNRQIRQDALREQLSNKGLVQQVLEAATKIEKQAGVMESSELQALKTAAELRLKLINKYLPDLKATELTGEGGDAIAIAEVTRRVIQPE